MHFYMCIFMILHVHFHDFTLWYHIHMWIFMISHVYIFMISHLCVFSWFCTCVCIFMFSHLCVYFHDFTLVCVFSWFYTCVCIFIILQLFSISWFCIYMRIYFELRNDEIKSQRKKNKLHTFDIIGFMRRILKISWKQEWVWWKYR